VTVAVQPQKTARVEPIRSRTVSVPERHATTVTRAGLVNRLRAATAAPVVLVNAPAGYGKTTLVAEWARRDGRPFAWYRVEAGDDAVTFIDHVASAVMAVQPWNELFEHLLARRHRAEEMVALLGQVLASSPTPMVIVLDDVELLGEPDSSRMLGRLVDELPPLSQLALVGRSAPALPFARLRARGQLVELGLDDLRFSSRETVALLRNLGVTLPPEQVAALSDAVEGWPAGLYLAALSLRASGADSVRPVVESAPMLLDYCRIELLSNLPEDDVEFLTRISVLERLCGPLCDAVADVTGSAERLERLERRNFFLVPLDRERRWYRIHGVLRGVLASELERSEPGFARTLRRRAAAWCAACGDPELGLEYAHSAGDCRQLVELIERSALPFTATAHAAKVERWLGALDEEALLERHPGTAAIGALTWAMIGHRQNANRWAATLQRSESDPDRRGKAAAAAASFGPLLSALMAPRSPERMAADAERALDAFRPANVWRPVALLALGFAHRLAGDAASADSALREAADDAAVHSVPGVESAVAGYRSLLATEAGDSAQADALADDALRIVSESRLEDHVASLFAYAASARAALRNGDSLGVRADLDHSARLLPGLTDAIGSFAVFLRLEFARVYLALGDTDEAARLMDEVDRTFARRRLGILRDEARELRAQLETSALRGARTASLTAAELRLLPLLTTHLSFREIAEQLYVSRNTVKTQAISVYRKLGVSSRAEAIGRAEDLGLVAGRNGAEVG
jgi:LuxR family maltose regulon positive regulatory protein